MIALDGIWVYLQGTSLLWLILTLAAWWLGDCLYRLCGRQPLVNPVLIAILLLAGALWLSRTPYETYFAGAQFVHFLLGPATVALAVPIRRQWPRLKRSFGAILVGILCGSVAASLSAMLIGFWLGVPKILVATLAPKSVTTPVAMAVSENLGGLAAMAAVFTILTGMIGAVIAPSLGRVLRIRSSAAAGLGMGVAAHGIGTATLLQQDKEAGAWSGLAMGLNALVTPLIVPILWLLMMWLGV
jgi:predicted murein hydrolase (TIGR00659 family)